MINFVVEKVGKLRVLILTRNAWDDTNSIGNTMSNFFKDQKDIEFANIYFRSSKPNNKICTKYFHVTEKDILRHWFSPSSCGSSFVFRSPEKSEQSYSTEKKIISLIHKYNLDWLYTLSEKLWDSRKWLNKRLNDFVESFNPDLVFSFAKSAPQYYWTIRFLKEKFNVRVILWIADDEYSGLSISKKKSDQRSIERLRYILGCASNVWGCSEEICSYYNGIFGCNATPLYKSCCFVFPVHETVNNPIRIIYAGNLLFGRLEILNKIIYQLSLINSDQQRVALEVYSNSPISQEDSQKINIPGVSAFKGVRPYTEMQQILSQADLVLHIESFESSEIIKTKYSFSTKIIDCLQSGSVLLAIGPEEISSIMYIKKIPGAIVIDDLNNIRSTIIEILNDSKCLPKRAHKIREYAIMNHTSNSRWLEDCL